MVVDKHLIKCLRISSSNEYLNLTSMECLIPHKHTLKILYKSKHFPPRYKRQESAAYAKVSARQGRHLANTFEVAAIECLTWVAT